MTGRELVGLRFKGAYSERSGEGGALPDLGTRVEEPHWRWGPPFSWGARALFLLIFQAILGSSLPWQLVLFWRRSVGRLGLVGR